MDVVVDVKEAQTGSFSAGAGFSSADSLLFNVRIQENNLFGRGQRLVLNGDVGSVRRNIILSFTEPYFRGTPLTVGFDAFSWRLALRGVRARRHRRQHPGHLSGQRFRLELALGHPARRGPHRRRLPARARDHQRHRVRRAGRHPRGGGHEPDQQHHAAHLAQHAEQLLRSDRRLGPGPVGRGRGSRRRELRQGRGARALVLHLPALEELRRLHLLVRRGRRRTASATPASTATSCRCSSATSRAASTRSAASSRARSVRSSRRRTPAARSSPPRRSAARRRSSSTTRSSSRSCRASA